MGRSWAENIVKGKYEAEGYDVIYNGAPDLILLKDGKISFVEVKMGKDRLSEVQWEALKLLKKHGFVVRVEKLKAPPRISSRPIGLKERLEIIEHYKNDDLDAAELWDLIVRSQKHRGQEDLTGLLMGFYNSVNVTDSI
jgi:hypothetical protein